MHDHQLDIVLPCYNPIGNWAQNIVNTVNNVSRQLPGVTLTVYLVNDGSLKGVHEQELALLQTKLPAFHYIHYQQNRGKGYALREGVKQTTAPICIYTDIDFPYTEESFLKIYRELLSGESDIAVGARDEDYYANVPATRVRISKTLRFFTRKMLFLPVNDTQAGLKGFNQRGREIFLKTTIDRYLFDLEFLFEAAKIPGIRITPLKVALKPGIIFSKMNSRILMNEGYSFFKIFAKRFL